ncbi:hypothetical protein FKM82_018470 [Ascaphus truei]
MFDSIHQFLTITGLSVECVIFNDIFKNLMNCCFFTRLIFYCFVYYNGIGFSRTNWSVSRKRHFSVPKKNV